MKCGLGHAPGLNWPDYKAIGAHHFRHTRNAAGRANWHPGKVEAVAGRTPGSDMAARSIAAKEVRERLLRDAGLEQGHRRLMDPGNKGAALAKLLQHILAKTKGHGLDSNVNAKVNGP